MYQLILVALVALFANASEYELQSGNIQAHTEVFGDSNINPSTNSIRSSLKSDASFESLKGEVRFKTLSLQSDEDKRDENMYELLNASLHPLISFEILNIIKNEQNYTIEGFLTLNGITKKIASLARIEEAHNVLSLKGTFDITLSAFGMEPPKLLFLTVRDLIDIKYTLTYNQKD